MTEKSLRVFKYEVFVQDEVKVEMPTGAKILHVGQQGKARTICIWALVDPNAEKESRLFRIVGTGHPVKAKLTRKYIGTVFDGQFVWHVFND